LCCSRSVFRVVDGCIRARRLRLDQRCCCCCCCCCRVQMGAQALRSSSSMRAITVSAGCAVAHQPPLHICPPHAASACPCSACMRAHGLGCTPRSFFKHGPTNQGRCWTTRRGWRGSRTRRPVSGWCGWRCRWAAVRSTTGGCGTARGPTARPRCRAAGWGSTTSRRRRRSTCQKG
jgi:hypothetical protein